jgi:bile acid-coenzyme A ligase
MTSVQPVQGTPYGTRIHQVAQAHPDETAIIFSAEDGGERTVTWGELDDRSTQLAHVFADRGIAVGDFLAIGLPNSPEHVIACFAGWKVGAVVVPMRWDLPEWERERVLATIAPRLVVDAARTDMFDLSHSASTEMLAEATSPRGLGLCSSGSTGTPKVIVMKTPGVYVEGAPISTVVEFYGPLRPPHRLLIPAPLYHANGIQAAHNLMAGAQIVLMERFNAPRILDLIERHRVTGFMAATTMLQRLIQVPDIEKRDLSSLDWVQQGASPLPVWLGRRWCALVGPTRFFLSYGASERHGLIICRGDEWLEHPGTLGRGAPEVEIKILDDDGRELPANETTSPRCPAPTTDS